MRLCGRKPRWDFLERRLSNLCRRYALIVSDHPIPFILVPIITTLVCLGGFAFKKDYTDATVLFTPQGARSGIDQKAIGQLFPQIDGAYLPGKLVDFQREFAAIVLAKDGGNILQYDVSRAVENLNEYVMHGIVIRDGGRNYTYQDLCMKSGQTCYNNPQIYIIPLMFASADDYANLSYPTATYNKRERYYLGATLGGVTLDPGSKKIANATSWYLSYQLKGAAPEEDRLSRLFEREYERQMLKYNDSLIETCVYHSQTLDLEVARNADSLMPRFTLMFNMLIVFAILCTLTFKWPRMASGKRALPVVDWTLSRPVLALVGVVGAGMGVATAIGLLCYTGYLYNNIVAVMPFLIIAVRLDNTFLMMAALDNTKRTLPVRERISEAMAEAAVSITITVLTDMFSFGFGVFTNFLAVIIFCVYTTLAIVITWIYQLTFFAGFLVLYARLEERGKHSVISCKNIVPMEEYEPSPLLTRIFCMGSRAKSSSVFSNRVIAPEIKVPIEGGNLDKRNQSHTEELGTPISRWFRDCYGRILMKTQTKIGVMFLLAGFWAVSIYGCLNLRTGLEPIRLLVDDSYAIPYYRNIEKYFWDYGQQVQVVVFSPGDLSNATARRSILDAVDSFSQLPHANGREGIDFWMPAFDHWLERSQEYRLADLPPELFYEKLNYFLFSIKDNLRYRLDVAFRNGSGPGDKETNPIVATRAMIGIKDFGTLTGQQETMDSFRSLANSYSSLNISTFHILFLFVDQYENIWPNVAQEIYSSMACMIVMSLVLIPHPVCAVWVTFAILSIDVGVIGFMTLWNLNMDTISMITIIMSIGFSVDFSAHIAYAYVVNIHETPAMRVRKALGSLGWPILQGGAATLLGVVFLSNTHSYMIVSFFKTVLLVVAFGLLHGLIFLPVLLNLLMPSQICGFQCVGSPSDSGHSRNGQPATLPSMEKEATREKTTLPDICNGSQRPDTEKEMDTTNQ